MPWQEIRVEEQRALMVQDHEEGMSISELSEIYGVSRKTVYKWLERHGEQGMAGLNDVSRRPHHSPNQVTAEMEAAIVAARHRWRWGPGKLRVKLCQQDSEVQWPAVSTIAAVLKAKGLVVSRRNRPRVPVQRPPYIDADTPNRMWNIDYKGWFRCGDRTRVDPLTISDGCSRLLLRCQHVSRTGYELTQPVFDATFSERGLPWGIHSDNGPPFASVAPGGLSKLSIWFVKLGIVVERSRPGCPQDNGRHERMHRTLKEATANPPKATVRLQQQAFHAFQREYNEERPHEALDNQTPASCYQASPRCYPRRVPELEYGDDMETRVISQQGSLKWKGERTFISEVFAYETIGVKAIDERWMEFYFGPVRLGWFDSYRHVFSRRKPKALILLESPVIL
jgi:transposase InsO family protein